MSAQCLLLSPSSTLPRPQFEPLFPAGRNKAALLLSWGVPLGSSGDPLEVGILWVGSLMAVLSPELSDTLGSRNPPGSRDSGLQVCTGWRDLGVRPDGLSAAWGPCRILVTASLQDAFWASPISECFRVPSSCRALVRRGPISVVILSLLCPVSPARSFTVSVLGFGAGDSTAFGASCDQSDLVVTCVWSKGCCGK